VLFPTPPLPVKKRYLVPFAGVRIWSMLCQSSEGMKSGTLRTHAFIGLDIFSLVEIRSYRF